LLKSSILPCPSIKVGFSQCLTGLAFSIEKLLQYNLYMYKLVYLHRIQTLMQEQPHILLEEKEYRHSWLHFHCLDTFTVTTGFASSGIYKTIPLHIHEIFALHINYKRLLLPFAFYLISYVCVLYHDGETERERKNKLRYKFNLHNRLLHKETILLIDPRQGNKLFLDISFVSQVNPQLSSFGYFALAGFVFEYSKIVENYS
ncbi:hypothetical protein ACJX0J_033562, partial [Zea mays]